MRLFKESNSSRHNYEDVRHKVMILSAAAASLGAPIALIGLAMTLIPNPIQPAGPLVTIAGGTMVVSGTVGYAMTM